MTTLNPYLGFRDQAREALDYYQSVFGGTITRSTFGDFKVSEDPAEVDKIMHSQLTTDNGLVLMASDTPASMDVPPASSISVSLSGGGDDDAELRGYWSCLSGDGTVTVPLENSPWGDAFGMCVDKYGVNWMVNIQGATA